MVVEQVELNVMAGREEECLNVLAASRKVLETSKGCRSLMFGRGVEEPTKVMLVVVWDSLELHKAATQTADFAQFSGTLRGFVTGAKAGHFAVSEA
jgi:heme-degrading monooxygenase HmoA